MPVHGSQATVLRFSAPGAERVRPRPPAFLVAIVALLVVGALPGWAGRATAQDRGTEPTPGGRAERIPVIVALEKGVDPRTAARRFGVAPKHVYRHAINGFAAEVPVEALNGLQTSPQVASVTPDYEVRIAAQTLPTGINRIDADTSPMADISGGGDNIAADVAVIDTGVDRNHPDLKIAGGYNCTTQEIDKWDDDNGHGTHVAGTIGAVDNNAGVVGVAPGVRLWGVKVLGANGSGKVSDVICGLNWVIAQKTSNTTATDFAVVNMSLGGDGRDRPCDGSDNFHGAVCNTVGAGIPVVVAAGNGGESAARTVPATWKETIAVSAFADLDGKPGGRFKQNRCGDRDDTFADFSNFGPDVDIAAPGVCIVSTLRGGGYGRLSGTSMAAPHVAGAVALFKATNPNATPDDVRAWLLSSAASRTQRSDVGFTGDPDRTRERVLYLGPPAGEGVVAAANDGGARDASEPGATDAGGQPADVTTVDEPTETGRTGTSRERRTGDRVDPRQEREREHWSHAADDGSESRR